MTKLGIWAVFLCTSALSLRASAKPPELVPQSGHDGIIQTVIFSCDGKTIATAATDLTIRLWDVASGRELRKFPGTGIPRHLTFSRDNRFLLSNRNLFDVETGALLRDLSFDEGEPVSFNPLVIRQVNGSDGARDFRPDNARGEDLKSWKFVQGLDGQWSRDVNVVAYRTRGSSIRVANLKKEAILLDTSGVRDGATQFRNNDERRWLTGRNDFCLSADGHVIAAVNGAAIQGESAESDNCVRVWQLSKGGCTTIGSIPYMSSVHLSPDGKELVTLSPQGGFSLYSTGNGRLTWANKDTKAYTAAFSPSGDTLAVSCGTTVRLFRTSDGHSIKTLEGVSRSPTGIAFSETGDRLATSGEGLFLWDLKSESSPRELPKSSGVTGPVRFLPGQCLGGGGERGGVWSLSPPVLKTVVPTPGSSRVCFQPDGARFAEIKYSYGRTIPPIKVFDSRAPFLQLFELKPAITPWLRDAQGGWALTCFSGSGLLATAGHSTTVQLWDETGKSITTLNLPEDRLGFADPQMEKVFGKDLGVFSLAFSPDGQLLAIGTGPEKCLIYLWEHSSGKLRTLEDSSPPSPISKTTALAFSRDGSRLASGSDRGDVRVWDVESGSLLPSKFRSHQGEVTDAAFSPGDTVLATASEDQSVRLWNPKTGSELVRLYSFLGGDWLAVNEDGFFDGSPGGWSKMAWRLNGKTHGTAEPEQFFRELYYPGLIQAVVQDGSPLSQILAKAADPRQRRSIGKIALRNQHQPRLQLEVPPLTNKRLVSVKLRVSEARGGVKDVRLFNNGSLAYRWSGPQRLKTLNATIPVSAGENKLVAYAYNQDNIKGKDAVAVVVGAASLKRRPQAYVLSIGIDEYTHKGFKLECARRDALTMIKTLKKSLPFPTENIHSTFLPDCKATKSSILGEMTRLSKLVQPEDTLIVTYAGHGATLQVGPKGEQFHLLVHDLGDPNDQRSLAHHGISNRELEDAFYRIQCRHIALVLDCCHSGAALDGDDWRQGPINSRGLAQMAWEKGMEVIAASQSRQVALEVSKLGHGLLTYALNSPLQKATRDRSELAASEWLAQGKENVQYLVQDGRRRGIKIRGCEPSGIGVVTNPSYLQLPRIFHRREGGGDWIVSAPRRKP